MGKRIWGKQPDTALKSFTEAAPLEVREHMMSFMTLKLKRTLAKRFDAPPVNTFRAILTGRGWSKNRIKEPLKNPTRMSERDHQEFAKAEEADKVSSVNQSETQTAAEVFEDILCAHFDFLDIRFRRQEE